MALFGPCDRAACSQLAIVAVREVLAPDGSEVATSVLIDLCGDHFRDHLQAIHRSVVAALDALDDEQKARSCGCPADYHYADCPLRVR